MEMNVETNSSPTAPKPSKQTGWRIWWSLLRPHTLTAAFVPVFIGTAYAMQVGGINQIHLPLFFMMLLACLLIQAATNMFNEYFDYKRGLDHEGSVGIGGAIVRDGIKPKTVLNLAFGFFGIAILLGVYICMNSSWWLAAIGLVCMAVAYLYTGGPIPIAYTPFGELTAGLFMGVIIIGISFFIQTGAVTSEVVLLSIPSSILIGAILLSNNIRDLDGDKENGRKTLAILVGRERAVGVLASMFIVSYIWTIALIIVNIVSPWMLIVFLSAPKAFKATKGFIGKSIPMEMVPAMIATAKTNTIFGLLMGIGLLLGYFL
ncbi:1,4-dihydroxy-2-naphthoate polyprenyltransferase [Bacillus cereus]|uniref:1,4-dihydroxy-2-naphthoate octaprenyltransferase n=1 Tax=Bacillus paramycoides TaxID=2026194 RepID=A0A1J9URD4_9BACI|nr:MULTISPECIES: 1,4-dihydroxy-2-naphthoate polyprenyltransferase [Bacillus]PFD44306.1 1,4-dihydroxy-2-naphthoate polyprenyltransferase [Bacillus cereus]KMN43455.1 1,4-dihydroxy-2-naphthoate octaprenyltransferase [Bacillus sp. LK2]MED0959870.1 1,4-dihydroxy-2-naphthoate polyprenyltransferase [Bacillus paramycoides]MED0968027.1 1,4-dihydroxy-2-naphthoate polyprenyltransferase [Bacillus paramycoides]MED0972163.1 1,4-dihydroxy-2-naphthoate polyprenyltransferase [Bacillus paramycoides]